MISPEEWVLLQSGACPVASYMFVPSAWIAVFLEACGVLYCSQMEIYRTLSVNKKLVHHTATCEVAPVAHRQTTNAADVLKTGGQPDQGGARITCGLEWFAKQTGNFLAFCWETR